MSRTLYSIRREAQRGGGSRYDVARVIKRQSSGLNRENDTAALFDETCPLSSLFSFYGMETVSFHGSMCSPFDGDLAETYLNDAVFFAASLAFPPIDARCIRPRTNRRSSRISKNEDVPPPRGNYNFFLFPGRSLPPEARSVKNITIKVSIARSRLLTTLRIILQLPEPC